jgi:hypothetical protein
MVAQSSESQMKYKRGLHPHSIANLRPQKRGQPSHGPNGRRGKSAVVTVLDDPQWLAYCRKIERDAKWVDRVFRKQLGCSVDRACEVLKRK